MITVLPRGVTGCLHGADPLTTLLITAHATSYLPYWTILEEAFLLARIVCLEEQGGDGDILAGPSLLLPPRAFPGQIGEM